MQPIKSRSPRSQGALLSQADSSDGHSSENLQDRMVRIVGANQITWTVIELLYHGHSSENLQDRMVRIVSANQITRTVIEPLYHGHSQ